MELDDFKVALEGKRHQEILKLLNKTLERNASESKLIEEVVANNTQTLEKFLDKLQEINKELPQDINIETNQDLVVRELIKLAKDFKINIGELKLTFENIKEEIISSNTKVVETIESRLLPHTFDLIKENGITQSVKVNYKEANKINNKNQI